MELGSRDDGARELWHPAFLQLGFPLEECAQNALGFCQKYFPQGDFGCVPYPTGRCRFPREGAHPTPFAALPHTGRGLAYRGFGSKASICRVGNAISSPARHHIKCRCLAQSSQLGFSPKRFVVGLQPKKVRTWASAQRFVLGLQPKGS
jgi:hypothetical protein